MTFGAVFWLLCRPAVLRAGYAWLVMAGTILICVLATLGLAYSLYPYVILDRLTIWEAASATSSLMFVLYGVVIVMPFTLGHTIFVYSVFHGKASDLSYGDGD